MVRLKKSVNIKELEKYGFVFVKSSIASTYTYFCSKYSNCFQSVDVYVTPFINAWNEIVYQARQVVVRQHAFYCDKAVDVVAKLITEGIFEYIEKN